MPKITGPTIAQHVADQEAAVFAAAIALFEEHGVDGVSMGTIAGEVGLARSSLYRYFPNKAAIVHHWFSSTMEPLIAESGRIARSAGTRSERFTAWVDRQLEFLAEPAHQTMIHAALETHELNEHQRAQVMARHHDLYASLELILAEDAPGPSSTTGDTDDTVRARVLIIVGLLQDLDGLQRAGLAPDLAREELRRAATLIAEIDAS